MAAAGGGNTYIMMLIGGGVLVAVGNGLHWSHAGPVALAAALLAVGGLLVVFGSCEAMIKSVHGVAKRVRWNQFVAGTMAGLASNVPEVVMLGFVVAKEPRVGFIVVALTLHVGAATFGLYSALLPRDESGHANMPAPLVKISTDLYACAGAIMLVVGMLMVMMRLLTEPGHPEKVVLTPADLYVLGAALLMVEFVAVWRLVARFSEDDTPPDARDGAVDEAAENAAEAETGGSEDLPSVGSIVGFGVLGVVTSVIGGHAVGDFADILVAGLTSRGYPEMVGALLLSVFACSGVFVMVYASHSKGMHDIALVNVSGAVTQVPFVVMPIALIMIAAFTQLGVVPGYPGGGALPIDLATTSVLLLGFPPMLILFKAISDDGMVNWLETAVMISVFSITIYFLVVHG